MQLNTVGLNQAQLNTVSGPAGPAVPVVVATWHEAGFDFEVQILPQRWHDAPVDFVLPLTRFLDSPWAVRIMVAHEAPFGSSVSAYHEAPSSGVQPVGVWLEAGFALRATQLAELWHTGEWAAPVGTFHESGWTFFQKVGAYHEGAFASSVPVGAWAESLFDLDAKAKPQTWNEAIYASLSSEVRNITGAPFLQLRGAEIPIAGADIAADEGGYAWTCTIDLVNVIDYQKFKRDDPFTLVLFEDHYEFILESKGLTRDRPGQVSITLAGVSPSAVLDFPRADPITKTWNVATLASAIATEVAGAYPVTWAIADWTIPAFRMAVSGASPLSVLQQLATAAGGVVESQPDGSLLIRPEFLVSVPNWATATPDLVLTDELDNLSVREGVTASDQYNRYYLSDVVAADASDRLEFTADPANSLRGDVLVYPGIWRENLVVSTTRNNVFLAPLGVVLREEEETIEVVRGSAQTAYPIDAILSATWLDRDLGGVSFAAYSSKVSATAGDPATDYSLLKLRYRTKALSFRADSLIEGDVQFLLEEV